MANGVLVRCSKQGRKRSCEDCNPLLRLDFRPLHPDDPAIQLQYRPNGAAGPSYPQPLEHFFHFSRPAGIAQLDTVAGAPVAQGRGSGGEWSIAVCRALDAKGDSKGRRLDFARDGDAVFGDSLLGACGCFKAQAQLARGALGAQALCQFPFLAGTSVKGKTSQCLGCGEIELCTELAGGMAQQAALHGRSKGRQPGYIKGQPGIGGSATSADRPSRQNQLRGETGEFCLPPGFFVARQLSHLSEVVAEARIPGFEQRQQLMADAVAGEGGVAVGGVLAPALGERVQKCLNVGPAGFQHWPEDAAFREFNNRMNSGETFGPGAAQEFGADGFGLVVEGVGGGDCIERNFPEKLAEPGIAEAPGGFFDGFAGLDGFGRNVDLRVVEGQFELGSKGADKLEVGVGFRVEDGLRGGRGPGRRSVCEAHA